MWWDSPPLLALASDSIDLDGIIQNGYLTCGTLAPRASLSAGALINRHGRCGPLIIKHQRWPPPEVV